MLAALYVKSKTVCDRCTSTLTNTSDTYLTRIMFHGDALLRSIDPDNVGIPIDKKRTVMFNAV